ncbi:MAG: TlpA disulfide reductase family protein [Flavobacteriaceae bacterium]|jgi:thiol-disulfide isomerase/thioredoxin
MRNFLFFLCLILILSSCKNEHVEVKKTATTNQTFIEVTLEDIPTVNYEGLEPIFNKKDDKTYVINFWATWCLPCVKELPYFERINQEYKDVEVILVSLDFPKQKEKRLISFVNKKKIQSQVIHFDDFNEQVWIPKIDKNWSGAIPATIIYNKNKRKFYEQSFTEEELQKEVQSFLKS